MVLATQPVNPWGGHQGNFKMAFFDNSTTALIFDSTGQVGYVAQPSRGLLRRVKCVIGSKRCRVRRRRARESFVLWYGGSGIDSLCSSSSLLSLASPKTLLTASTGPTYCGEYSTVQPRHTGHIQLLCCTR